MTLLFQASVVLAASLVLARLAPVPAHRRDLLTLGAIAVLALPLLGLVPAPELPQTATLSVRPIAASPIAATTLQEPASSSLPLASFATVLWVLGTGLWLLRTLVGAARIARLNTTEPDAAWMAAARQVGLAVRGHHRLGPFVAGWIRPAIVVPDGVDWSHARRVRALRHEAAHLRSRDTLRLLGAEVLVGIGWFHPLAWWLRRELRVAMEQAADAAVVQAGSAPTDVAADLVDLASSPRLAAAMGGRPLERRVRALLERPASVPRPIAWGLGAILVLTTLAVSLDDPEAVSRDVHPQDLVDAEVQELVDRWKPEGVAVVVFDTASDQVVASGQHGSVRAWSPGSLAKPFVAHTALEHGRDGSELAALLEVSDNDGFVALVEDLGTAPVAASLQAHGLEASASLAPVDLALGQFPATTDALARAYARLEPEVVELLVPVVHGSRGTGKKAAVAGRRVAGKTGTSVLGEDAVLASFVGLMPAGEPRWVIAVQVANPQGGGWGGKIAAPSFARIAAQLP